MCRRGSGRCRASTSRASRSGERVAVKPPVPGPAARTPSLHSPVRLRSPRATPRTPSAGSRRVAMHAVHGSSAVGSWAVGPARAARRRSRGAMRSARSGISGPGIGVPASMHGPVRRVGAMRVGRNREHRREPNERPDGFSVPSWLPRTWTTRRSATGSSRAATT